MKHLLKTIVVGLAAYVAIRFFVLVASEKKPMGDALKQAVVGPVDLLSTTFGLALQPGKWRKVGEIAGTAYGNAKGESRQDMATIGSLAYEELVKLNEAPAQHPGAERAQT